jgi:hypothetical protein
MASFKIATIYKDHATLRGYEKCGLDAPVNNAAVYTFARVREFLRRGVSPAIQHFGPEGGSGEYIDAADNSPPRFGDAHHRSLKCDMRASGAATAPSGAFNLSILFFPASCTNVWSSRANLGDPHHEFYFLEKTLWDYATRLPCMLEWHQYQ